jgi:hypothetical protein
MVIAHITHKTKHKAKKQNKTKTNQKNLISVKMLVVIDTDCTGSCKSNYHKTTTTTTPLYYFMIVNKIFILFDKT